MTNSRNISVQRRLAKSITFYFETGGISINEIKLLKMGKSVLLFLYLN